jgi:hypothetical protein
MSNMIEQKYIVVRAKAPRKRKIDRFETKYLGGDPKVELREFIDRYKLRELSSARLIPYLIDDSTPGLTMRTLLPSGVAEDILQ